jgi:outer membrane protein assembly factor BamA
VVYDRSGFNYTFIGGHASWKFGREDASYSLGVERPLLPATRLFVGAEFHDITTSDDLWRLNATEQTVASAGWKNTFRDYYRRKGVQVHVGMLPDDNHEVVVAWRSDRHQPLINESDFSLFRRDDDFRPNPLVADAELHAIVVGYTFDSLGLREESFGRRFTRHLFDDLFRARRRGARGWRLDWSSEIAGHGIGGDYQFTRHILNLRGATRVTPRQTLAGRAMAGWSSGALPLEREFALGGVGTVHAYKFKDAAGSKLALLNGEYAFDISGDWRAGHAGLLRVFVFVDAGRVGDPLRGSSTDWLSAVGFGLQTGGLRVEWGFRTDDFPGSAQVLVRLGRGF